MKRTNNHSIVSNVLLVIVLISVIFPFLWVLLSSFKNEANIISYPPKLFASHYTLANYTDIWKTIPMTRYIINTVIYAVGVCAISVTFDSFTGYALARMHFRGRTFFYYVIMVTMFIPFAITMIPLFMELSKFGMINTYAGLIIPHATTAFGIFMMRSFFVGLPEDLAEAARLDGLNEFQIYFRIMLPLAKPQLITLTIFSLMGSWNDLLYPMLMTTDQSMRTLAAGLALIGGQHITYYGPVMAGTIISMLPLFIIYMFAQKYFIQGSAMSGMKE
ncbi:carbohydrate ABC transporter permease [Levilactobacillus brevis]|uniref:carbohydrate ABC transporter permease n=2 Tax=Levilactobacillus brevis TaxID=1580 RepID=UPI0005B63798|nr:carbohydrate ABC transporter permease [Levilactobacillus brevis]ARW51347.1 Putative ABC transporter permease protein ORF1 [Levilactobacillus brevis]KIR08018.1 ABC transporter permease [Levilactobacillus brevis]OOV23455.1 ABC transporter permease [Levilactobacillus brevis]QCZ51382.1 N-Acetyl-D-glucosamine ABC transport system2C permease protein 2 [Levilactobacillus brevis]